MKSKNEKREEEGLTLTSHATEEDAADASQRVTRGNKNKNIN